MNAKTFRNKELFMYLIPTIIIDLVIQIIIFRYVAGKFHYWDPADLVMRNRKSMYFLIVGFFVSLAAYAPVLYQRALRTRDVFMQAFMQTLISYGICAISVDVLFHSFAGKLYLPAGLLGTAAVFAVNLLLKSAITTARKYGRNKIHAVVVGENKPATDLYRSLKADNQLDYKMLGMFSDSPLEEEGIVRLGSVADVEEYVKTNKVHNLYCAISPYAHPEQVNALIHVCENSFVDFFYVPDLSGYIQRSMNLEEVAGTTVLSLREEPLSYPLNRFVKRSIDVIVSGLLLITIFPPVWLFAAIGTLISSPGPIFFKQKRTGYKGKPFLMYKFRSMKVNADADKLQATEDDPRKTKFGDFLRRTSIDEIPQLINIFKGDMSIIGPRPHMEYHTSLYNDLIDKYMVRHMVKPGLTGWAQVNGYRGETKTLEQMEGRVKYDIWYIENWSLIIDVKIFFMTIFQVIGGDKQAY